jgi:hypothetical protein
MIMATPFEELVKRNAEAGYTSIFNRKKPLPYQRQKTSEETKKKISSALKGRVGLLNNHYGKKHTEESQKV